MVSLNERVAALLRQEWDPIGVHDVPAARDEYDAYVGAIAGLLRRRTTTANLAAVLVRIESEDMGLRPDLARAERVAAALLKLS
jgi:IS1 family transposase